MDVTLSPELKKFIDDQVREGHYESAADAINAAVARLQEERDLAGLPLEALRAQLDVGLAEADRGELEDFTAEDVIAERRATLARNLSGGE